MSTPAESRENTPAQPGTPAQPDDPVPPDDPAQPHDPVQRWVDRGIITAEQAEAIRADLTLAPAGPGSVGQPVDPARAPGAPAGAARSSLLAEALGYLGGALILVAFGIGTGQFWDDLPTAARLGLTGVAAAGLFAAGSAVPVADGSAAQRLRSVLWLVSTGLAAGFLGIAGDALHLQDAHVVVFTGTGTAGYAAFLWRRHRLLLQHLATVAALIVAVTGATALLPDSETSPAASAWALGVTWYLLAWAGILSPRREAELIGAAVAAGSTPFFAAEVWGTPLALVTLVAMAGLAVMVRDLALLGIDAVAALMVLPAIVTRYFPGALSAAAALLLVGILLVLAGVMTVRRPEARPGARPGAPPAAGPGTTPARRSWAGGTARDGWLGAGLVVGMTAAALLVTALL